MGLHVLRGEFPVFFAGQGYLGALESCLTAAIYAVAGASYLTVKLAVFALACRFIAITSVMARRMAGWPGAACSTLVVAVGPPFLPLWGNYAMMGYMEVVVVGSLVLQLTLDLLTGEHGRAASVRKLMVLGLLAGLGWWINPMMLSYLGAAGLLLLFRPRAWWARGWPLLCWASCSGAFRSGSSTRPMRSGPSPFSEEASRTTSPRGSAARTGAPGDRRGPRCPGAAGAVALAGRRRRLRRPRAAGRQGSCCGNAIGSGCPRSCRPANTSFESDSTIRRPGRDYLSRRHRARATRCA